MHAPNRIRAQPLDSVLECSINNLHIVHAATMLQTLQVSVGFAVKCMKHCAGYLRQLLECNIVGWVLALEHTQAYF